MQRTTGIIRLSDESSPAVRFLSGLSVSLSGDKKTSWITLTRTGKFSDPRYGEFDITSEMLLSMVSNFQLGTYGQDIVIDLNHDIKGGAAADIKELKVEGTRLRALVEWTSQGVDAVRNKRMKYLSAEFHPNYKDNEEGKEHGPLLLGAALTVRPVIKHLDPVELSETGSQSPIYIHPELIRTFAEEAKTMKKYLLRLRAKLEALKFSEDQIVSMLNTFKLAAGDSPEEAHAETLLASFESAGVELAETVAANPGSTITLAMPNSGGMTSDDVNSAVEKALADRDSAAVKLTEDRNAKVTLFTTTINAAEGLSAETKKTLCEDSDLITADMSDEQVKKFATNQIKHGNDLVIAQQLSSMGYSGPAGSLATPAPTGDDVVALQEHIDVNIGLKGQRETLSPFCVRVLAEFDRTHAVALADERKLLAGGTTGMVDTNLPAGYRRTVIREALSDLNILNLINAFTEFGNGRSATVGIPYELRDISNITNDGIVYEGQEINAASISQEMDLAYVNAMKIALNLSNEVVFFTANNGAFDWSAYARNVESNARVIRELICRRICNELQRSADAFGATARATDTITAQVDGVRSLFKSTYFPIVRSLQVRDLKGTAVGNPENPIVVTLGGVVIQPYDGTGNQAAGTYYRITSYNLGYIQFVTEAKTVTPVVPANATTLVLDYSESTNVTKFDLDVPAGTTNEDHLNGLLRKVGARKAILSGDRFISEENMFMLMSPTLNNTVTDARAFIETQSKKGTRLNEKGDLSTIKAIEAFGTNAPGVDLGDERILMGEAGLIGYAVVKPFETGQPFEAVGPNGLPTGKKVAYGEEYNAIKLPVPLRNRLTSVLAYSVAGRAAA